MDVAVGPKSSEFWVGSNTENLMTKQIQESVQETALPRLFVSSLSTCIEIKPLNLKW